MNKEQYEREQARLELMQRRVEQRLTAQQERVEARLQRIKDRLERKYGKPSVTQQRIIAAALELLQEDGLSNVSLRKLAAKLDIQAPAIYWHFKNKDVLIDYMAEAILYAEFKVLEPRTDNELWQDWLVETCQRLRRAMLAHRDGARVVAGAHLYPAVTLLKLFEVAMQSLLSAGVDPQQANLVISTAVHFVFGTVIEQQSSPTLEDIQKINLDEMMADYPLMLKSAKQSFADAKAGHDEFEASLRLIIRTD